MQPKASESSGVNTNDPFAIDGINLFEKLGLQTFINTSNDFNNRVCDDEEEWSRSISANSKEEDAIQNQSEFFVQRMRGPPLYNQRRDWCELHCDLLDLIVKKIKLIEDFLAFRIVCKCWRDAAKRECVRPQIPLLLLAEKKEDRSDSRRLYSPSKGKLFSNNLYLPEAVGKKCIGLNYGWILTISLTGEINLLHPLSRAVIELPHQSSITEYEDYDTDPPFVFIMKAALSGNPFESSDFVLMIIHCGGTDLSYWRLGDKCWTSIPKVSEHDGINDITYYQDHFYAITYGHNILACKVSGRHEPITSHIIHQIVDEFILPKIVASRGALLFLDRASLCCSEHAFTYLRRRPFILRELDLIAGKVKTITSLGDRTIFIGQNTSICFDHASDLPGINPGCVYFTDELEEQYCREGGGQDMGCYSMENREIKPFDIEDSSTSTFCPPFWFIPAL